MLEIQGRLVPLASEDPQRSFLGRLRIEGGRVHDVLHRRWDPPEGVTQVDVGEDYVYPGLIDLHSHLGYAPLPLWHEEARDPDRPWLNRNNWPNAPSYKPAVSWPGYAYMKAAPEALMVYAQVRALAGGTTTIQGWPPQYGRLVNKLIRNVDDDLDADNDEVSDWIRTSVVTLSEAELNDRRSDLDIGKGLIYHLCEGQRDSTVASEFEDAARAGCLRHRLFAIHCNAVGEAEFEQWRQLAAVDDAAAPGGVVWSPLSNLWLYGETTDVAAALRHGLTVCLGSDWAPSGSKNLLNELKVAHLHVQDAGLELTAFDLVQMVTAGPGDLLARVPSWADFAPGRLENGRAADAVVVARRFDDPWTNLVMATERDVRLVVVDGEARYGERALMRAAGQTATTSAGVAGKRRHIPLRRPDDPGRRWTWTAVSEELDAVRRDPMGAIEEGLATAMAALADPEHGRDARHPILVLEPDMPGGPSQVAGPPPPDAEFTMPPVPSLAHDRSWLSDVGAAGYGRALLGRLRELYP
jgi:5-methylthioadenosine/S-adenosylhomocysteine deaminase